MLEPMLDAFENWNSSKDFAKENSITVPDKLTWEEKFIMLLWLSHLARTPFDLASISSRVPAVESNSQLPFIIPIDLPVVACRLLLLGFRYIQSNTKEQEAARLLLVRLCTRPDMFHYGGLCEKCVEWARQSLYDPPSVVKHDTIYSMIGCLSFLAGFFNATDSISAGRFIYPVLETIQKVICGNYFRARIINASAVARKSIIKINRSCATHLISSPSTLETSEDKQSDALNMVFDHLMTSLKDKDSQVRFAASKALSMVAQQLDPDNRVQVVDDISMQLDENVLKRSVKIKKGDPRRPVVDPALLRPDISNVNPLRWQGLILTLSHLLFRHSLPQERLETIIGDVVPGLDFEQRSSMGVSMGSSVRDAACFGVWSLARNYKTSELLQVPAKSIISRWTVSEFTSIFVVLAAELIVTATLDPEGNVRRAASAALQELVGRHPEMVPHGIALVQVVDYHAVGLRSRAMSAVALDASRLHIIYLFAVLDGLLSWRAIGSPEVATRRQAATVLGEIYALNGSAPMAQLYQRFQNPKHRSLGEWHGLYLALAAAIRHSVDPIAHATSIVLTIYPFGDGGNQDIVFYLLHEDAPLSIRDIENSGKDAYLPAEALCTVINALGKHSRTYADPKNTTGRTVEMMMYHRKILESAMKHCVEVPLQVLCDTAVTIFNQLPLFKQNTFLQDWLIEIKVRHRIQRDPRTAVTWIAATSWIFCHGKARSPTLFTDLMNFIVEVVMSQLGGKADWQAKVATLAYLFKPTYNHCTLHEDDVPVMYKLLMNCLHDYSIINSRDVGSQIRIQAIDTIRTLEQSPSWSYDPRIKLFAKVHELAAEKTDRVRESAWNCIKNFPEAILCKQDRETLLTESKQPEPLSTSDIAYFEYLLRCSNHLIVQKAVVSGIITSASSGNENLIRASRTAITNYIETARSQDVDQFHSILLEIIPDAMPDGRLLRPGLEVLGFVLDVDSEERVKDDFSGWRKLLRAMPEIRRRSTDIRTLEAIVRIYAGLERYDDLWMQCQNSLRKLLAHRFPKIRLAAAAALYVIQPDARLERMDLGASGDRIGREVEEIYG